MNITYLRNFSALFLFATATSVLPLTAKEPAPEPPKKEISDKVSDDLGKLKEKVDAKDYDGAVKLLDDVLTKVAPDTYDLAMVSQIKAQILLTEGKYADAIPPLVTAQDLGERFEFFDKRQQMERLYLLGQIHYQLAADSKDSKKQDELFTQAYKYVRAWLNANPKPTSEGHLFAASILYAHGTVNPNKPNLDFLRQSVAEAKEALYLSIHPSDQNYLMLLAGYQQLGNHAASAEILELLVQRDPKKIIYWQQLASSYLTMAGETNDPKEIHHLQLRTVVTMQRAQGQGLMDASKDNLNLVSLFFNLEQYSKAAELLSSELDSGKIENTRANWEMLGLAYQQAGKEDAAIHSLLKATELFPTEGQLELTVSQLYYGDGNTEEAFDHLQKAVAKGNLKKPGAAYLFLGLTAYELQKFDEALKWAGAASKEPDVKPEDAKRLARAASEALKEHTESKHA